MNELEQFIEWLPANIKEFENMSGDEVVETVNKLSKTDPNHLEELISEFRNSAKKHKFGGKIDYLINKYRR